ncbi:conjugal transfer protein [Nocardia sp. CWNU-33]|uniref:conjugal transfer protein n=1 Tax=Nocardia sp. CWNU-33 TaxID=3392117 RepID=UPI00398F2FAC
MKTVARGQANSGEALLRQMAVRRRRENVMVAVLAVLAVLGGGHAIFSVFQEDPPGPSDDSTVTIVGHAALVGSFGEQFVMTYLTAVSGQQEKIGEFAGTGGQITLPSTPRHVSDPVIVYTSRERSGGGVEIWAVTISVRVAKGAVATAADARQYYRVAVSLSDGQLRALSIPAVVEPPAKGPDLSLAYSSPCAADTPLSQVAAGFLGALLAGSGDVGRYITQASGITALKPSPFTTVELVSVTTDDNNCGNGPAQAKVLATVNPKGDGGAWASLAYPLSMIRSGGQWQVQSIDPVPALTNPLTLVGGQDSRGVGSGTSTAPPSTSVQIPPAKQN